MAENYYMEERPWGWFKILLETPHYKVKELLIKPGCRVSYQSHTRRSEHWLIVQGTATVILDDKSLTLEEGMSTDILTGTKHRIGNNGTTDMVFIEVQRGDYFGEDDITRYEDDYNRV
jgi:mannose-6-phosphate isomerase-like protein (cupin superfamily)